MAQWKVADLDRAEAYKLLSGSVIPRPIAWITTKGSAGVVNLAPYSAYNMLGTRPVSLTVSIGVTGNDVDKDTLRNIKETKEFVVNAPRPEHVEKVALSAAPFPSTVSEAEKAMLAMVPSTLVKVPRLVDAIFSLECRLYDIVVVGDGAPGTANLVIGEVLNFHVDDAVHTDGRLDFAAIEILSRVGGYYYSTLGPLVEQRVPRLG